MRHKCSITYTHFQVRRSTGYSLLSHCETVGANASMRLKWLSCGGFQWFLKTLVLDGGN